MQDEARTITIYATRMVLVLMNMIGFSNLREGYVLSAKVAPPSDTSLWTITIKIGMSEDSYVLGAIRRLLASWTHEQMSEELIAILDETESESETPLEEK